MESVEIPENLELWEEETTSFDRVYSIIKTTAESKTVAEIADKALVSETTARNHLQRLHKMTIVRKGMSEDGIAVYHPDPLHTKIQTMRDLLNENTKPELIDLYMDLNESEESVKKENRVETPDELRTKAAQVDETVEMREMMKTASNWEHIKYRMHVITDAIENYETYTTEEIANDTS